jgi:hypothetical protein
LARDGSATGVVALQLNTKQGDGCKLVESARPAFAVWPRVASYIEWLDLISQMLNVEM